MSTQQLKFQRLSTTTTLTGLTTLAIVNQSSSNELTLTISGQSTNITLAIGQSLSLSASSGFQLPDIEVSGTGLSADVISSI